MAIFNATVFMFGLALIFSILCNIGDVGNALNAFFGSPKTDTVYTGKQPVYFQSWYRSIDDLIAGNAEYAGAAEAEGAVLLKNDVIDDVSDKKALPLDKKEDRISLFGVTAYDPMYSLGGAGRVGVNAAEAQYFATEFEKEGFAVNKELEQWYKDNLSRFRRGNIGPQYIKINGAGWQDIATDAKTSSGYNTAVYVVGRMTNEAYDLAPVTDGSAAELTDGDYLRLTEKEVSVLKGLAAAKASGTFDRIIVLINSANPFQEDFIDNSAYDIDAALWIGYPGSHAISAVADILSGATTPSGRLSAAWYSHRKANPTWNYFGNFNNGNEYVLYQEGVYVGYKYAETRYEDYVTGRAGAGNYIYDDEINYSFGYGLSYTTFGQEIVSVEKDSTPVKNFDHKGDLKDEENRRADGDDYIVKVKVTNIGRTAGKEVVQLYLQQPYTDKNIANGVEKPSVELIGVAKTSKLDAGDSETVEIKIDANKYFATYDITQNKYILDAGAYYIGVCQTRTMHLIIYLRKKAFPIQK